jgi:glycosyltransferase involved in cell wall biosynthesis
MDHRPVIALQEDAECWISACRLPPSAQVAVSVVVPNYCAEETLLRAVHSVLTQSLRDIELIIVDDASGDNSWELIADLLPRDERVRAVRHKVNQGKPVAMNRAIALARGRWLAVLDADDWYHTDRLRVLTELGEATGADLVADNQFLYDASAGKVVSTAWPENFASWPLDLDDFLIGSNAYETFNLGMLKPVIRLDFMRRVGLAYEEKARHGQDFFHLLQFYLCGGRAVISDRALYFYTQPFGRLSRKWSHTARKRYDFQNAYEINQRYLDVAERILLPRQWKRLKARNQRLQLLEYYYRTRECLSRREWTAALALMAGHPRMMGYLLRRLYGRIRENPGYYTTIHRIARRSARQAVKGERDA